MKKQFFLLASLCLLLGACEQSSNPREDNTARNVRDRGPTMTSGEQGESETDRTMTQNIRQSLMDDDSLSTNGKNVKIITRNGTVVLRGAVNSDKEKNDIGRKAQSVPGVKNVENQIEVIRRE